jgi:formylglycine-generating enzyme required for sulfatase activity
MVSPAPTATAVDLSRMVEIPAGEFLRGVDEASLPPELFRLYSDAMPQRPVYLDRYYIDRHPVTKAEFAEFLNATGHHRWSCGGWHCANVFEGPIDIPLGSNILLKDDRYRGEKGYPVKDATWNGAQAYCQWQGKRLPTEAEWEKAARGIDGRWYPWGDELDPRMNEHERGGASRDPIGSKPYLASPYGVEDLLGPLLHGEWVADWYAADYYGQAGSTDNPQGPAEGEEKVTRGWRGISVPIRKHSQPVNQVYGSLPIGGFRCAYTPPPGR